MVMRIDPAAITNAVAWVILLVLTGVAFVLVNTLGPFGLILLGLLTLYVCTAISLREDNPTWGVQVFRAQTENRRAPRLPDVQSLKFCRLCGMVLLASGLAGFAWQHWH